MTNYIRSMVSDPINEVIISGGGAVITGYIDGEQVFGASSSYGDLMGTSGATKTLDKTIDQVNATLETNIGHISTAKMSRLGWQSSSVNGLSFGLYFISMAGENPMDKVRDIWKMVLPKSVNPEVAPLNYRANTTGEPTGTLSVKIGNWFTAQGFVCESALITVSREKVDKGGTIPLYVKVDINLIRVEQPDAETVQSWFS